MTTLKVATLNLHSRQHRWQERRHLIVGQIIDASPDLLSLQEINLPTGQGKWLRDQVNTRLSGAPHEPYQLVKKRTYQLLRGYLDGVGILTKLPVISHDALNLGYDGRVALRANVALPSGETLDFVATHLHPVARDRQARLEQVMLLGGWLTDMGGVPLQVIAGDFNEVPDGPAIEHIKQTYRSALAEARGYEPLATFPTALAPRADDWSGCLDYIFVSSSIEVSDASIFADTPSEDDETLYPSDHVGLVATLYVEEKARMRRSGQSGV
jgi:endonuclease/exonuclease/phosphatase family metal-dependent hydrolase